MELWTGIYSAFKDPSAFKFLGNVVVYKKAEMQSAAADGLAYVLDGQQRLTEGGWVV